MRGRGLLFLVRFLFGYGRNFFVQYFSLADFGGEAGGEKCGKRGKKGKYENLAYFGAGGGF